METGAVLGYREYAGLAGSASWCVASSAYRLTGKGLVDRASIAGRRGYAVARCMAALVDTVDTHLGKRGYVYG